MLIYTRRKSGFGAVDWGAFWKNSLPAIAQSSVSIIDALKGQSPGASSYALAQAQLDVQAQNAAQFRQLLTLGGLVLIGAVAVSLVRR